MSTKKEIQSIITSTGDLTSGLIHSKQYATGNGTTDDTAALNQWIAAGNNLYLDEGTYKISATIASSATRSGVSISFHPQAKIVPVAAFNQANAFLKLENITNLLIEGAYIEGNGAIASPALTTWDNNMYGIFAKTCTNVLIRNSYLTGQPKAGIYTEDCSNVRLYNNIIPSVYNYAIWVYNSDDVHISGNTVSGQGEAQHNAAITLGLTPGIMVTKSDRVVIDGRNDISDFKNTGTKCEGCLYVTYSGNIIRNVGKDALKVQSFTTDVPSVKRVIIIGNTVENLKGWASDASSLIEVINGEETTIVGNICSGAAPAGSIEIGINFLSDTAFVAKKANISGNIINNVGTQGIFIGGASNVTVTGNVITDYARDNVNASGILAQNSNNLRIHNNTCHLTTVPATGSATGIFLSNCYDLSVKGNDIKNAKEHGVRIGSPSGKRITVSDNDIYNTGSWGIYIYGTGTVDIIKVADNLCNTTGNTGVLVKIDGLTTTKMMITDTTWVGTGDACYIWNSNSTGVITELHQGNNSGTFVLDAITPSILKVDGIFTGTGSPEGVVTAPIGALYIRKDGSTSTTLYVKTSGTGNTGWTAK